jgi:microsomal dipeptidase-like Zn-dependent dipeptidase
MKYFDLHLHLSLKSSLCVNKSAWDTVKIDDSAPEWLRSFRNVIDSQANLSQTANKYELVIAPIVGLEKAFAKNLLIKSILPKHSSLDQELIKNILHGKTSYLKCLERDRDTLVKSIAQQPQNVVLVNKNSDYDPNKLNVLLAVEGAHSFKNGNTDPVENFKQFKNRHRVFYLALTHLSREDASAHAYGVKVKVGVTGKNTDEEFDDIELTAIGSSINFMPSGKGLTALGVKFIEECLNQPKDKVTLVDIKHMSFYARQYFYQMRIARQWTKIPIIASHVGFTGTALNGETFVRRTPFSTGHDILRLKFWRKKGLGNTLFNTWSINLYNEDIITILESKGLIGLSFDQRIVGAGKIYPEIFSGLELQKKDPLSLYYYVNKSVRNPDKHNYVCWNEVESDEENEESFKDYLQDVLEGEGDMPEVSSITSFINNLLYAVKVGLQHGYNGTGGKVHVWDHLCIGSDLDGLIDSLDFAHDKYNCVTAANIDLLVEKLRVDIKIMANYDPSFDYQIQDIDNKLEKLFYANGKAFTQKFLNGTLF